MSSKDYQLNLKMRADFKQAQDELRKAQGSLDGVIGKVNTANLRGQAMAGVYRTAAAGIVATGAVATAVMAKYIANTIESEKVQAQLMARIKDTGHAAGRSLEQLNAQASKLQDLTVFDDEAIGGAQAMLLTFKEIQGLQFDEAVKATLNLSTAMGQDLQSSALLVGKALNDPVAGLTALSRAGVQFTEDQKALIKSFIESGDKAKAQEIILAELAGQMGSAAEAARDTLGGALQALQNSFDNLLEGDSGDAGITGTREAVEELIRTFNDPATKAGFDRMVGYLVSVAEFAVKGIAAVGGIGQAISDLLAENEQKSRLGLLSRRADLADDLADFEAGGLARLRLTFGGRSGATFSGEQAMRDEIAQIDKLLRVQDSLQGKFDATAGAGPADTLAAAGYAPVTPKKPKTPKGSKADPDAGAKSRLASLREELALLNSLGEGEEKASEAAKARYETTEGEYAKAAPALKAQIVAAAEALDQKRADIAAEKERKKKLEETRDTYKDLREALRTPAEAALDDAIEKVATLNAALQAGIASKAEMDDVLARIAKGLVPDQPGFDGLAPELGGAFGELSKLDKAAAEEQKWYDDSLQRLQAFREASEANKVAADAREEELEAAHQARMKQIQESRQYATLAIASDFFGRLATLQRSQNSKMAAVGKAAAIAQTVIDTYQSATAAYKAMAGIPYVGPALGIAAAAAAVAAGMANVAQIRAQQTGYASGGYTGPGGKYEPAGIVHKGEGVLSQEEIRAIGGPQGFYALRDAIDDGSLRQRMYGWAGYADGGLVASPDRPSLAAPEWEKYPQGRLDVPRPQVNQRNYLVLDREEVGRSVAESSSFETAVLKVITNNPRALGG